MLLEQRERPSRRGSSGDAGQMVVELCAVVPVIVMVAVLVLDSLVYAASCSGFDHLAAQGALSVAGAPAGTEFSVQQAAQDLQARLQEGRGFAILPDLRVPQPDVEVDFLRGKANVSHAGAMFAVKCGSPIVVAVMRRENGRHVFDHIGTLRPDPAAPDKKEEAARLTREAMKMLDERIQAHPEHWFWYNKRWILQPVKKKEESK